MVRRHENSTKIGMSSKGILPHQLLTWKKARKCKLQREAEKPRVIRTFSKNAKQLRSSSEKKFRSLQTQTDKDESYAIKEAQNNAHASAEASMGQEGCVG